MPLLPWLLVTPVSMAMVLSNAGVWVLQLPPRSGLSFTPVPARSPRRAPVLVMTTSTPRLPFRLPCSTPPSGFSSDLCTPSLVIPFHRDPRPANSSPTPVSSGAAFTLLLTRSQVHDQVLYSLPRQHSGLRCSFPFFVQTTGFLPVRVNTTTLWPCGLSGVWAAPGAALVPASCSSAAPCTPGSRSWFRGTAGCAQARGGDDGRGAGAGEKGHRGGGGEAARG